MHEFSEQEIALLAACGASVYDIEAIAEDCAGEESFFEVSLWGAGRGGNRL